MSDNAFTFSENTDVQYHLIPQPKEVTNVFFTALQVIRETHLGQIDHFFCHFLIMCERL